MTHVRQSADVSSGLAIISVDDNGQNCITVIPGANGLVTPDDVLSSESVIANADVMLLQLEIPLPAVLRAMELAKKHGIQILFDPAPAPLEVTDQLLRVDVLCPNETEAEILTGLKIASIDDAFAACERLRDCGAKLSIVTLGSRGVVFCEGGGPAGRVPPYEIIALDTTAAGDAFAGALGVALAEGRQTIDAIRFASAAGALAATRHGAQPAMPRREDVERFMIQQTHQG